MHRHAHLYIFIMSCTFPIAYCNPFIPLLFVRLAAFCLAGFHKWQLAYYIYLKFLGFYIILIISFDIIDTQYGEGKTECVWNKRDSNFASVSGVSYPLTYVVCSAMLV